MKKETLIILAIFIATAFIFLLLNLLPEGEREIPFKIPVITVSDADRVIMEKGEERVVLEKRGGEGIKEEEGEGWEITHPINYPADRNLVKSFFRTFKDPISMDMIISEEGKDRDTYETTEEKGISLSIFQKDSPLLELVIGKSAGGGSFFLAEKGKETTYRAKLGARGKFEKGYREWMERGIFDFKKEDLLTLDIVSEKGRLSFRAEDEKGDEWAITSHPGIDPDHRAITRMARTIGRLKASEVVLEEVDDTIFAKPWMKITAGLRKGVTHQVIVGKEKDEKNFYVKNPLTGKIYLVSKSRFRTFEKGAKELRNKAIFDFKRKDVEQFSVRDGKRLVVIEQEGEKWKVVKPARVDIPEKEMTLSVNTLSNLRASEIADGVSLKKAGISSSNTRISARMADGTLYELIIGNETGEEKRKEFYVKRADRPFIYLIREYAVKNLKKILR